MKKFKIVGLLVAFILVALDIISKNRVTSMLLENQRMEVIPNFFWLTNVHNTGAGWSLFASHTSVLTIISIVASIALIAYYLSQKHSKWTHWGLILMIAGTIGNLIDRAMLAYVRDFLSFNLFGYMFPVFNLADAFLTIGVLILIMEALFDERN